MYCCTFSFTWYCITKVGNELDCECSKRIDEMCCPFKHPRVLQFCLCQYFVLQTTECQSL
jgi:hypothetical protein